MFKLIALAVAGLLWFAWLFAKLRECEGEPLKIVLNQFSRLAWFNKIAVLFIVVQLTMFGGAKHGTNDVDQTDGPTTNDVISPLQVQRPGALCQNLCPVSGGLSPGEPYGI